MLAGNLVNVFLRRVPSVLAHNQEAVLRPFDFPAPMFQFLIGVSLALFLRGREAAGRTARAARGDALGRFAVLVLLGVLLDSLGALRSGLRWGVLQTLGLGGAVATLLAAAPPPVIAAVAAALLAAFAGHWNGEVHASPLAALAFAPLTLAGLLAGRALAAPEPLGACARRAATVAGAATMIGLGLREAGVPFDKLFGSSSFVALATAVSAGVLAAAAALERRGLVFPAPLVELGRHALNAWVLQYLLVFYPAWLVFPAWERLPLGPGLLTVAAASAVLGGLAVALGRRGIRVPL
jgi:hypothetical protein